MSKINDLIKKLCANGVKYKKLEDCCNILDSKRKPVSKGVREVGEYPYYGANGIQDYINDYIFDGKYVLVGEDGSVQTAYGTPVVNWATGKIWVNNHAHIIEEIDGVSLRYLYHYLQIVDVKDLIHGNIPKLNQRDFRNIRIAIPPLEVQEEIVRILDKFGELEVELETELEARKSQYEFWRDKVFEPKDTWTNKTMEELCTIITKQTGFDYSATIKPSLLDSKSDETYSFIQNKDFDGIRFNFDTDYYIPKNVADKYPKITLDCPSILFSISGKIGNVGLYESEKKAFIGGAIAICKLKPTLNNKYILYYLQSKYGQQYLFGNIKAASHLNVTVEAIRKINIKFPSLDEQKKIVNILDKFEGLINDISVGLPAEIELRRKQYEYYRNILLCFDEIKGE